MRSMVFLVLLVAMFLVAAQGVSSPRLGVVDLHVLFEGYYKKEELEKKLKNSKGILEGKLQAIDAQVDEIRGEIALLEKGTSRFEELERKLFGLVQERRYEKQRATQELARNKARFHEALLGEIRASIRKYGREHEYIMILQKEFTLSTESLSWHSILYHSNEVDLTATLMEALNAEKGK